MKDGLYRRHIRIEADGNAAIADIEDDCHRFGVDIRNDGLRVTTIVGRALRTPWTTCALARPALAEFQGTPLLRSPFAVLRQIKLAQHCTHMVDMAAVAIAAAARRVAHRRYAAAISVSGSNGPDCREGTLQRNDEPPTRWVLHDGIIAEPARYRGLELRRAASWVAEKVSDEDDIEALFIMLRAMLVAASRRYDLDATPRLTDQPWMLGACFAFQPVRVAEGRRHVGNTRDFTDGPAALLADLKP